MQLQRSQRSTPLALDAHRHEVKQHTFSSWGRACRVLASVVHTRLDACASGMHVRSNSKCLRVFNLDTYAHAPGTNALTAAVLQSGVDSYPAQISSSRCCRAGRLPKAPSHIGQLEDDTNSFLAPDTARRLMVRCSSASCWKLPDGACMHAWFFITIYCH